MGMGHVPPGPLRPPRQGDDVPGREHRGAGADHPALRGRRALGAFGEQVAAGFLARRGATILGRNLRAGHDEIDLLASFGRAIVVVEVKTVRAGGSFAPSAAFTPAKCRKLRRAAHRLNLGPVRLDLVTVVVGSRGVDVTWTRGAG